MHTTTSSDGTRLAYDRFGSGPALVVTTGATCFRNFMPVKSDAKTFAKQFTVYSYDRRGRDDSEDTAPYAIDREIEDIEAMIDAAGGSAYLYGHSSGAVLALEAALRLPEKVRAAVVYDASYVSDEAEKLRYTTQMRRTAEHVRDGDNAAAVKYFLTQIGMPSVFVALLPLLPGWRTMKALAPTLMYDVELTKDLPPVDRLAGIRTPVHVAFGSKSPAGMREVARRIADAVPGATFEEVAGQDHMVSPKVLLPILTGAYASATR